VENLSKKILILLLLGIAACSSNNFDAGTAQVYDLSPGLKYGESYVVKPGDSLYYIAWHYGLDYRELAQLNNIKSPYNLSVGQKLDLLLKNKKIQLHVSVPKVIANSEKKANITIDKVIPKPKSDKVLHWSWPVQSKNIIKNSTKESLHRGIDIGANYGAAVKSSAKGIVVYAGSGIRDFGSLVIIKHGGDFITAYGYNDKVLVKEGQRVNQGETIAVVGHPPFGKERLHFVMRKHGKPLNPLIYLPKIKS